MMVGEEEFPEMDDLAALKGVIQYPLRIKCATLAWTAFPPWADDERGRRPLRKCLALSARRT
jgi:NifU-like protein involved in Fe-S cluster formation